MGENLTQLPWDLEEMSWTPTLRRSPAASPALAPACGHLPALALPFKIGLFLNFIVPSPRPTSD